MASEGSSSKHKPCTCGPDEGCGDPCDYGAEDAPLTPEEEEEASEDACTCARSGDCFAPLGHYRDCPCAPTGPEDSPCANESGCYHQRTNDCENGCRHAADELSREANEMVCQACLAGAHGPNVHREEPPPQPERRPPYAVAYSVQGHLYEVALPGDATVRAVDGALVIQHHLGPVAGITSVLPVINKEAS